MSLPGRPVLSVFVNKIIYREVYALRLNVYICGICYYPIMYEISVYLYMWQCNVFVQTVMGIDFALIAREYVVSIPCQMI